MVQERAKECRQSLEAGKGKEIDSPLEPPEGTQLCLHLDFSPVRLLTSRTLIFKYSWVVLSH